MKFFLFFINRSCCCYGRGCFCFVFFYKFFLRLFFEVLFRIFFVFFVFFVLFTFFVSNEFLAVFSEILLEFFFDLFRFDFFGFDFFCYSFFDTGTDNCLTASDSEEACTSFLRQAG